MNTNIPLELQDSHFDKLDTMQKNLICKLDALDLVLIENANEIFRDYMQEGINNNRIEKLLDLISLENKNSVSLPSITFKVSMNKKNHWFFSQTKENKESLKNYISESDKIISGNTDKNIIFTIIGFDLGEGGHYGSILCDIKLNKIYIFDSMSGSYGNNEDNYNISGLEHVLIKLAKQIFIGDQHYVGIKFTKKNLNDCKVLSIENDYILQATGGFENFISPSLYTINKPGKKLFVKKINIQHTDSQNHFCYIWSIWFIQIYLRGGVDLFHDVIKKLKKNDIIPIIVIKKYILGFINLLGNIDYKDFFYKRFPLIWSNYKNPLENDYHLYSFNYSNSQNIIDCMNNSLLDFKLKKEKKTLIDKSLC